MAISASELRQNIYRLLDEVLETGLPLEIERKGKRLRIVPVHTGSRLERIQGDPELIVGDPDDLVHLDWSPYWRP
ncbi:MAG TPA: type II toxin-antitoxin system Phd/YefM family antitoxin [Egibacteraceae bacterium]|nr:type II toxin-antitoxin system Phd/YefM family antitoxin [Egibacteraceae bacterium]